jgi:hypothetical protein
MIDDDEAREAEFDRPLTAEEEEQLEAINVAWDACSVEDKIAFMEQAGLTLDTVRILSQKRGAR